MNTNINYIKTIAFIVIATLLFSCGHNHSEDDGHDHDEPQDEHTDDDGHGHESESENEEHHEEGLHLSKEQIETVGLEFGETSSLKVNDFVKATGTLGLPPNAIASVSAKSNGIIKGTKKFVEGNYIQKGEVIAYLENPEFIVKQQDYLEAKAQFELKKLDVIRQKSLMDANAGVVKNLQNAETELAILEAKSTGLSKQLAYLGISTNSLSPNSITQQIAITAPMSGYVSSINFHNGMYVQSSIPLMDIVSSEHLHLELDVFEKDIAQIKVDQKISYTIPALGTKVYQGEVSVISKEFNVDSKSVRIHGHMDGDKPQFVNGLFINAKIWLSDNTSTALPENALIQDGENMIVYVGKNEKDEEEVEFTAIRVIAGATDNGYTVTKFIDPIPDGMQIVTKGAYFVYAQSKAGELEHEH
jgi:cobalt-zinc-cadmium efflux system membrane fusion protein